MIDDDDRKRYRKADAYYAEQQRAIWRMEDFHPEEAERRIRRLALVGEDFATWAERQREGDGWVIAMKKRDADRYEMGQREAWFERTKRSENAYIVALCAFHDPRVKNSVIYQNFKHPYPDIPPPERQD